FFFQQDVPEQAHQVPTTVQVVNGVSLLSLIREDQRCQNQAPYDAVELDRIRSIYGALDSAIARNVITDGILREYKDVNLLGFTFSSRRYFEALLVVSLLVIIGIFSTVQAARGAKLTVITGEETEDFTDIFVRSPLLRFFLWVVSIPVAIWLALPPFAISAAESYIVLVGIALLALLGLIAFWRSRVL